MFPKVLRKDVDHKVQVVRHDPPAVRRPCATETPHALNRQGFLHLGDKGFQVGGAVARDDQVVIRHRRKPGNLEQDNPFPFLRQQRFPREAYLRKRVYRTVSCRSYKFMR